MSGLGRSYKAEIVTMFMDDALLSPLGLTVLFFPLPETFKTFCIPERWAHQPFGFFTIFLLLCCPVRKLCPLLTVLRVNIQDVVLN